MPEPADDRRGTRRVVVAGASGLIGSALVESLRADGVEVTTLVRRPPERPDEVEWLTGPEPLDPAVLEGADAVVGLNGANLGRFPWTASYKNTLLWSRITPTRAIARAVRQLGTDAPGLRLRVGCRVLRLGAGQAPHRERPARRDLPRRSVRRMGGRRARGRRPRARRAAAHRTGRPPPTACSSRCCCSPSWASAARIGRGTQVWPWISLDDEVRAIRHVIDSDVAGPVNLAGPTRATANDLGFALAVRMNRPFLLRAPVWGMKLVLGADATEAILTADMDVVPDGARGVRVHLHPSDRRGRGRRRRAARGRSCLSLPSDRP